MESSISPNGHVRATEIIVNGANLYESILKKKIIITILNIIMLHMHFNIIFIKLIHYNYSQALLICELSGP